MSGVRRVPLSNLMIRPTNWNPSRDAPGEDFNYIDLSAVDNQSKQVTAFQHISTDEAPSRARQLVKRGDILVSTVRPNLNGVAEVPENLDGATASTGFCVLRPNGGIHGRYLFHWVKASEFVADMVKKATGASYPAVSDRIILDSEIPLFPLEEQWRIAAILDQADTLRRQRRAALVRLELLASILLVEIFGEPEINKNRYTVVNFSEVIVDGPSNGLYKAADAYGQGTRILRINNFYDGKIDSLNDLRRLIISDTELGRYALIENDIVINRVNSREYLGKSALIPQMDEPLVYESNMMRLRLDRKYVDPVFAIAFLQTDFIKRQIATRAKDAVNQSSINQKDVQSFRFMLPPLDLQRAFAERVRAIEALKARHRAHLAQLDALFASLQHRAFRGEL